MPSQTGSIDLTAQVSANNNAKDYSDTIVDNLEIGGRNLLLNSKMPLPTLVPYNNSVVVKYTTSLDGVDYYYCSGSRYWRIDFPTLVSGETYNLWFDIARSSDNKSVFVKIGSTEQNIGTALGGVWTRLGLSFVASTATYAEIRVAYNSTSTNSDYIAALKCIKLEKGNKVTDWTPAPEDVDELIANAATTATNYITADANGISIHMANESNTYQRQTSNSTTFYVSGKKRSQVGADGLHVYVGSTEDEVANFGATARIGKTSEKHLEVAKTALAFTDGSISESPGATSISGNTLFSVNTQGSYTGDPFDNASALARGVVLNINGLTVTGSWLRYRSSNNSTLLTAYETNSGPKIAIGRPYNENANNNTSNVVFDYHSMQMVDKEGTTYFYVSDLRDESGYATLTDMFVGDGIETRFTLQYFAAFGTSVLVTVNDIEQSEGTDYELSSGRMTVVFNSAPSGRVEVQYKTQSTGAKAFTFGSRTAPMIGAGSAVIGTGSDATGRGSKAIGNGCLARGANAIALGNSTQAYGVCSHAQNYATTAGYDNQTVIGKFNANDPNNAFEIGNGTDYTDSNHSNAFTVTWDGNIMAQGMAGMVQMFAGSTPPTGWLLCHGQAISRTDYATLFAAIGTTWGSGNGSTTFNVPDLRGRAPIGAGTGSGLTARTLAAKGGSENIQAHTHTFTQPTVKTELKFEKNAASGSALNRVAGSNHNNPSTTTTYTATVTGGAVGAVSGATTGSAGNMQPFAVINFIICTGKTS